jgi:hypothetical protein
MGRSCGGASWKNYQTGMSAFEAATRGSLCVRNSRLPKDFDTVIAALRAPNPPVRLIVCAQTTEECEEYLAIPITIPPLSTRCDEVVQIIMEYAEDALAELGASRTGFLATDRDWVRMHSRLVLVRHRKGHAPAGRDSRVAQPQPRGDAARNGPGLAVALDRAAQAADARRAVMSARRPE